MGTKAIANEARIEAAAAEILGGQAAVRGFVGSARMLTTTVAANPDPNVWGTVLTQTVAFTPAPGRSVKVSGFLSGTAAIGTNGGRMAVVTSIDAGVTWTEQESVQFSGISTAGEAVVTELGPALSTVLTGLASVPTLVALSVNTSGAAFTTTASAIQGQVSVEQL